MPDFTTARIRRALVLGVCLLACCGQPTPSTSEEDRPAKPGDGSADSPTPAKAEAPRPANQLAKETSPYLLLHAHNPVNWYPWGEAALAKARREKKLIFLSIGYSSCYWCHVMERESFMDNEIAAYLNKHFVAIKVDREERPDIDDIYMTALQALGRRGGWPLTMFLAPDGKPIVGGTYFPPREVDGRPGLMQVLTAVQKAWSEQPEGVQKQADALAAHLKREMAGRPAIVGELEPKMLTAAAAALAEQFDPQWGGFGFVPNDSARPKFPEPNNLVFLLDQLRRAPDESQQEILTTTLDKMAQGGIFDHVGGGFHRYSIDRYWRVPHFEKMLYDNAQLLQVYAAAFALTEQPRYRRVAERTAEFVLREMRAPTGAFYAALDAETDAEEGKFYVWEKAAVRDALGEAEFPLFAMIYGLDEPPNFEGQHVLLRSEALAKASKPRGLTAEQLDARLAPLRKKLLAIRDQRPRPLTDTKILTSWNGLMIAALADAGRLLERPDLVKAAAQAADYLLATHRDAEGRLLHTSTAGKAKLNAYLDDYAFLVAGLLALDQADDSPRWLMAARELTDRQVELFWDDRSGGFYFTSHDHEALIARSKDPVDGVIPSGNSVAAENLLALAQRTGEAEYTAQAKQTIRGALHLLQQNPAAVIRMATVLAEYLDRQPGKAKPEKAEVRSAPAPQP